MVTSIMSDQIPVSTNKHDFWVDIKKQTFFMRGGCCSFSAKLRPEGSGAGIAVPTFHSLSSSFYFKFTDNLAGFSKDLILKESESRTEPFFRQLNHFK